MKSNVQQNMRTVSQSKTSSNSNMEDNVQQGMVVGERYDWYARAPHDHHPSEQERGSREPPPDLTTCILRDDARKHLHQGVTHVHHLIIGQGPYSLLHHQHSASRLCGWFLACGLAVVGQRINPASWLGAYRLACMAACSGRSTTTWGRRSDRAAIILAVVSGHGRDVEITDKWFNLSSPTNKTVWYAGSSLFASCII
jgi:hypothetical protein